MADEPLIGNRELHSPSFIRDLRSFLSQTVEVLGAISEAGNGSDGFTGGTHAQDLAAQYGIPVTRSTGSLRVAEYLFHRVADGEFEIPEAVNELVTVAAGLDEPIEFDEQRQGVVADILSFKRDFEAAMAVTTATSDAPHFIDVNGSWGIKPVQIRNGEVIRVPVITLSIVWHDGPGNNHEAFLQMSERDWKTFTDKLENLGNSRATLDNIP